MAIWPFIDDSSALAPVTGRAAPTGFTASSILPEDAVRLSDTIGTTEWKNPFVEAAEPAGEDRQVVCVTADAALARFFQQRGGFRVQHERLLRIVQEDPTARFSFFALTAEPHRLNGAFGAMDSVGAVPVYRSVDLVIAIAEARAIDRLAFSGWSIAKLGGSALPDTHDLYLMRDAEAVTHLGEGGPVVDFRDRGVELLMKTEEGLIVAIPSETSIEELHFPVTHHGHNLKLLPDLSLTQPSEADDHAFVRADFAARAEDASLLRAAIRSDRVERIVARLSGAEALPDGPISSRHVHHPDADRAVEEIARELEALGLTTHRHYFVHEGRRLANIVADLPGRTEDLVLVTAHLDSRAGRGEPDYRPDRDHAPGADDDASGVAAVIAIAEALVQSAADTSLERTVRFALFHAEEHGLVGSRHYARAAADAGLPIKAVLQMDMIGYLPGSAADRRYEIHYGHRANPQIELRSEPLARLVEQCGRLLGELGDAEIYHSPDDPAHPGDPADGRSDHSSFQMSGFPAVIVSEDFFGGTISQPSDAPNNPQYHSQTDTGIDSDYAASIARAVALAAWTLARQS